MRPSPGRSGTRRCRSGCPYTSAYRTLEPGRTVCPRPIGDSAPVLLTTAGAGAARVWGSSQVDAEEIGEVTKFLRNGALGQLQQRTGDGLSVTLVP